MKDRLKPLIAAYGVALLLGAFQVAAQEDVLPPKEFCTEASLRPVWGDSWHIGYFLAGCWMYGEPSPSNLARTRQPRQFVMRGGR